MADRASCARGSASPCRARATCCGFAKRSIVETDAEMATMFERTVAISVDYEMLYVGEWKQNLLIAEHYGAGRVFLAGDAVHLVIPTGGLGMNSGVGDAIDLSWKLAAVL